MADKAAGDGETVIIKKYANRRLYNTRSSSYITLDHLAEMTRQKVDYKVLDAKSGNDITHQILTQIIMEEEASTGEHMLPVSFLRDLICMYGNNMQSLIPHYLEASMEQFRTNQAQLTQAFEASLGANPFAKMAAQNLEMFRKAASVFVPGAAAMSQPEAPPEAPPASAGEDELAMLRRQMAEMQKQLDKLAE